MASKPLLVGGNLVFSADFMVSDILIENKNILTYTKQYYPAALPRIEVGPLGQISYRQLNYPVPPIQIDVNIIGDDEIKNNLEGMIAVQQRNYARNNERNNVEIVLRDNRKAQLELIQYTRSGSEIKSSGNFSKWSFSQYTVKIINFSKQRFDANNWSLQIGMIESSFSLGEININE